MAKNKAKMNKFVTGVATAAMVATAVVPVASAAGFTDLGDNVDAGVKADIDKAVTLGFFKDAAKFNPSAQITRGQAALTLARYIAGGDDQVENYAIEHDLESKVTLFNDIPVSYKTGQGFEKELYYASLVVKNAGAFTQTNLNPAGPVTRSQMAKIVTQTFGLEKAEGYVSTITDIDHLDAATKGFIETIASQKVTVVDKFMPAGAVTRSQMASFLVRANDAVKVDDSAITVSAINGTITVKFNEAPETVPTAADFKVTQTINAGTATTVAPTVTYNATTKTATLSVAEINQTTEAQTVKYTVGYDGETYDASFVVAAPTVAATAVQAISLTANTVKVYFSQPVNNTTATNVANYANRTLATDSGVLPTNVTLNTVAEGSYAANQVATLTFSTIAVAPRLTVSNVTTLAGATIPTETFTGLATVTDGVGPVIATNLLTADGVNNIAGGNVQSGTELSLTATADDTATPTFVTGAEYRLTKPDGSFTAWTKLDATDAPYNAVTEVVKGKISTAGFGVGTYTVQLRATDAGGNTGAVNVATTFVVIPASPDLIAPVVSPILVSDTNFTYAAVTTGNAQQGAFSVRVNGSATDGITPAGVAAVQKVEHRLLQVNTLTGATTVAQGWTSATATDGAFGGTTEAFNFVTPTLTKGTSYLIQTRATDAAGNTSPVIPALVDATSVPASISDAISTTFAPPAGVTIPTGAFTVIEDDTVPTLVAAPAITTNLAPGNRERTIDITGTANDVAGVSPFTTAISNINKVEYAVYRDNGNGTRTLVQNYSDQGVTLAPATAAGTARGYSINYTLPAADGTYEVDVVATDGAGNKSAVRTTAKYILDVNAPTATIVPNTATPATNDFIVTFSEAVTPVVVGNLILTDLVGTTIVGGTSTAVAPVTTATPNTQYVITFDNTVLAANQIVKIVNLTDAALNPITGTYKVTATDLGQ